MLKIGPVVSINSAIISTNDNIKDEIVICEFFTDQYIKNLILMEVWEAVTDCRSVYQNFEGTSDHLPNGVCHTFQWRLEELAEDCEADDEWELMEFEEALDPRELIYNFPAEVIDDVTHAVNSWLASDYATMNSEAQ
jgi:hypothetical protein